MYMHIHGRGDGVKLAQTLRSALERTGTPKTSSSNPGKIDPEAAEIAQALGLTPKVTDEVLQFTAPRKEKITEGGMEVPSSMGVATAINFQRTADGKAAIAGDFVLLGRRSEPRDPHSPPERNRNHRAA